MVSAQQWCLASGIVLAALLVGGCDQLVNQDTQQKQGLTGPLVSGGRNPESSPAATGGVDFGDDTGKFAKDGECDDKRFAGPGMTDTVLLESDVRHDATDCRAAYDQHRLTMASAEAPSSNSSYAESGVNHIMWGDDASKFSKDGECDDKRFTGAGMTATQLLDSDIKHDATDCRAAYNQGRLTLGG